MEHTTESSPQESATQQPQASVKELCPKILLNDIRWKRPSRHGFPKNNRMFTDEELKEGLRTEELRKKGKPFVSYSENLKLNFEIRVRIAEIQFVDSSNGKIQPNKIFAKDLEKLEEKNIHANGVDLDEDTRCSCLEKPIDGFAKCETGTHYLFVRYKKHKDIKEKNLKARRGQAAISQVWGLGGRGNSIWRGPAVGEHEAVKSIEEKTNNKNNNDTVEQEISD